jgi:hypothetical protein
MSRYPLADVLNTATLVGGLPTVTFPPTNFHRIIRRIVVGNGVASTVNLYVGTVVGSTPIETNTLGERNSLSCFIRIPAGQPFFVQWSAPGTPVSSGFARITVERDDNPLVSSDTGVSQGGWSANLLTRFAIPTNAPPGIILTGAPNPMPADLVAFYGATLIQAVIQFALTNSNYAYFTLLSLLGVAPGLEIGTVTGGLVTRGITMHQFFASPQQIFIGDDASGSEVRINENGGPDGHLFIGSDTNLVASVLAIETGSDINVESGGEINILSGANQDVESGGIINVQSGGIINVQSGGEIEIESGGILDIQLGSTFTADTVSLPRGWRAFQGSAASSAAIGAETAILTTGGFVAKNDRAYRITFSGDITHSAANTCTLRVRKNTAAGAVVAGAFNFVATAAKSDWKEWSIVARNTTGADIASYNVCVTMQASAGTCTANHAASRPFTVHVEDIGDATDFPNALALA